MPPPTREATKSSTTSGITVEPDEPVALLAAPDQVGADDEPDEEVERAGPGRPREAVDARRLDDEERGLGEPADPDAPDREPRVARRGVGDRGLAVAEERRPEEQLSHSRPRPRSRSRSRSLLDELADLALEPLQLRGDDQDVGEHADEDDEVGGGGVLLGRRHAQASSSRSSRSWVSSRLPGELDLVQRREQERASRASETQNVRNCECVICGPCRVKTSGWMMLREMPDREERDRDQHDAEERVDGAHVLARRPRLDRVAEHEVGAVEEEEDRKSTSWSSDQTHQTPQEIRAQIEPVTSVSVPKITPWWIAT